MAFFLQVISSCFRSRMAHNSFHCEALLFTRSWGKGTHCIPLPQGQNISLNYLILSLYSRHQPSSEIFHLLILIQSICSQCAKSSKLGYLKQCITVWAKEANVRCNFILYFWKHLGIMKLWYNLVKKQILLLAIARKSNVHQVLQLSPEKEIRLFLRNHKHSRGEVIRFQVYKWRSG